MTTENCLLFLGDVAPYKPYRFSNNCKTVINLECPIVKEGVPVPGKIILAARENHLPGIFNSSLLCVNLGNNHMLDYGKEGVTSTIAELEKAGIPYFGLNSRKGNNPRLMTYNESKIAFFSAVCESTSPVLDYNETNYFSPINVEHLKEEIKSVRKIADRIVVYLHWGEEESSRPSEKDIRIARRLIDEGADIIIGSHAHSPQAIERYKYGIIAYNLGNFIMPEMKDVPSYYDKSGKPGSLFTSRTMLWNRVSWGIIIDMITMKYRIKKFLLTQKRVLEVPFTPFDKYLKMPEDALNEGYARKLVRHQEIRRLQRRITEFIYDPHIPQILKRRT